MNKQAKQVLTNKGLVKQAEQIFKGKYEIAILALKPGKRVSFELAAVEKDLESALETKKQLDDKAFMTRLLLKSKGNKYKATYLSDFNDVVCLTKGLNRTLEINIKQLRDKLSPRKNARKNYNLEMTGYMGFGYSQANCLYVCTRLYDTIDEAAQHINKRYSIDLDTVEILDVSRLSDGSFRFSKTSYDNMNRLKHVKLSKLIDKFGREEAYAMMEELEQQRQEIYNETETAKKLAKTVGKELIVDEYAELTFSYIDNALKAIKEAQKEITKGNLELLEIEDTLNSVTNIKEHNINATSKTLEAEKMLDNIKKALGDNNSIDITNDKQIRKEM